jgi:hypothetical protein
MSKSEKKSMSIQKSFPDPEECPVGYRGIRNVAAFPEELTAP